jgi:hypothetical protein
MRKRRKVRWKRVVLWSLICLLVVGVSGLFAVNYAVNKVIESMTQSLETDFTNELSTSNEPAPSVVADASSSPTITQSHGELVSPEGSAVPSKESTIPSKESDAQPVASTEKPSASKQPTLQIEKQNQQKDMPGIYASEISTKKAKAIKDNVTISEKAAVTSILMGHLSLSDLKLFKDLASGGMTVDEKREARKVLLDKLTPEEYNMLSQIAKKYGVSQGKTYDQVVKEEAVTAK